MTALILDGKATGEAIRKEIAADIMRLVASRGPTPCLVAVLVGEDPASQVYVRNKHRACQQAGIAGDVRRLPASTSQAELLAVVDSLNRDSTVHGILVQLPLPVSNDSVPSIDTRAVLDAIDPAKDVDAFSPVNVGLLVQGRPRFLPCTPRGIIELLCRYELKTSGKHVVVVGGQYPAADLAVVVVLIEVFFLGNVSPMTRDTVVFVARDISERKRAEQANEERIRQQEIIRAQEAMLMELMAVVGLANETNRLANGLRVEVDPQFSR